MSATFGLAGARSGIPSLVPHLRQNLLLHLCFFTYLIAASGGVCLWRFPGVPTSANSDHHGGDDGTVLGPVQHRASQNTAFVDRARAVFNRAKAFSASLRGTLDDVENIAAAKVVVNELSSLQCKHNDESNTDRLSDNMYAEMSSYMGGLLNSVATAELAVQSRARR